MSFLNELKTQANYTTTLNGAKTNASTGDACLDLFSVAGGMRYRDPRSQIRLFDRAYIENAEMAMKLLFYIRDIRGGMGERRTFRNLLRHLALTWPESVKKNVPYIPEYGRYDDLLCLMGTKAEDEALQLIKTQMQTDLDAVKARERGNLDAPVSLLAKWMPSINTSSLTTRRKAQKLAHKLEMSPYEYRKTLSLLRANSCLTERYLTRKKPEKIKYRTVPAGAMLKYRQAFRRNDGARFSSYLAKVKRGKESIHSSTLFPYEIVRPYIQGYGCAAASGAEMLEALWANLPKVEGNENAISVIDTSGSMYWKMNEEALTPALVSQSLGLYHAERCKGIFHNHFITFESVPHLIEIHGITLQDKLRYIQTADWGGSTNLEAVFDLILRTALEAHAPQEEMPSVLYIISDMEFNIAISNPNKTVYDNAAEQYKAYGYNLPAVVFINVNSWQMQAPVRAHTRGTALASGMGVSTFQHKFDGNVTPMSHMLHVLMGKRYEKIHA